MKINIEQCPLPVTTNLTNLLQQEIEKSGQDADDGLVLNFRDPGFGPESGGFHPVEVMVNSSGKLSYITDFAYCGGPFPELVKEIDFDFQAGVFGHMGRDHPIEQGADLYSLWESNFVEYHRMGVYQVTVSSLS
jgi:hypothetical protein